MLRAVVSIVAVLAPLVAAQECAPDLNQDGLVTTVDLLMLLATFGRTADLSHATAAADIDGSQRVDTSDLLLLLAAFGRSCVDLTAAQPTVPDAHRGDTLAPGLYSAPASDPHELLLLVKRVEGTEWPIPCARSYDGFDWEVVQPRDGPADSLVHVTCSEGSCQVSIPEDPPFTYTLNSRLPPPSRHGEAPRAAAHLLTQATFGPTRADIERLGGFGSEEEWVLDQIENQPPTLHRAFYRTRANPRLPGVSEVAQPRSACEPNSRWSRAAIRADDQAHNISFSTVSLPSGNNVTAMYVGGVLRSEVNLEEMRPYGLGEPVRQQPQRGEHNCNWCQAGALHFDTNYVVCRIEEWPMGLVVIGNACQNNLYPSADNRIELYNAFMQFDHLPYPTTDSIGMPIEVLEASTDDVTLRELPGTIYNSGVVLVSQLNVDCPFGYWAKFQPATTLKIDGQYYRYDPRAVLMENTLENPANPGSISSGSMRSCPSLEVTAPKTFLNEESCVISHGCEPDEYSNDQFQLNSATLRQFFLQGNNYVYAIDNLPVPSDQDPCRTRWTRWRALGSCEGRATDLDEDTRTVLSEAIRTSSDPNLLVKDIELSGADRRQCSNAANSIVDVDGDCWAHTHKDQLSVYDFGRWAAEHGGNQEQAGYFPIRAVATDRDDAILHYPSWHPEQRWRKVAQPWAPLGSAIGRLGDWISFNDLPRRLQSAGMAQAMNVTASSATSVAGIEMCGSPGEVANDPSHGQHFYFGKERYNNGGVSTQQDQLENFRGEPSSQKKTIHTTIALYEPDQLRQRVAWALSQTFVIADFGSAVLEDHAEVWITYYDIFVRHAFGNYRDILREVSFNPVMGMYLTYMGSASFAFKGSLPDENYAREIMQLFSIGLYELNEDGSQKMDDRLQPIPTYANENIMEFARIWTGFQRRMDVRGNSEMKRISQSNQLDPMYVDPEERDSFPKMDLYHGHIGDTYPLCADLPPRAFLRVGAKFRFLGSTGVGDLVPGTDIWEFTDTPPAHQPLFTPDSSGSALYSALCNMDEAAATCRFQSTVTLDSNLECYGNECDLETIRVIKIIAAGSSPSYYEYVQVPCVSLAFFVGAEGGRYIDNVNHIPSHDNEDELIERICADPQALVAGPGCCTGRNPTCFDYRCEYVEERMSFGAALQRCSADTSWWSTADPPPMPTGELARWSLFPQDYQTEVSECPPGSAGTADEASCLEAATAALAAAGEPHFNTPGRFLVQNNGGKPSGCFVDNWQGNVIFNSHPSGGGHENVKMVCKDVPEDLVANYRNASKLLCSRKRRSCWHMNQEGNCDVAYSFGGHETKNMYFWTEEPCRLQAQINIDGRVSVVHPGSESTRRTEINNEGWFRVRWLEGQMPQAASGCGGGDSCSVIAGESGLTCVCDIDMSITTAFNDASQMPSQSEVEEALRIGAPSPDQFDAGTYTICSTAACQAHPEVLVYTQGTAESPLLDKTAIFRIVVNQTNPSLPATGRTLYLANKQSAVTIANATHYTGFSFRNPPQFMTLVDPARRDALYETEALLDHLFYHQNVASFVSVALIKKLVTSNPSPRYVQSVATAFKTGEYGGRSYAGGYGDLGAATAAVLLDREARSLVLAADPTHGKIREPFIRLMHLMRALEYTSRAERDVELGKTLNLQLGQAVYASPTVFNFFLPEYTPEGPVQASGLVAPEAQLSILPNIIGLLDGMSSLIFDGLTSCAGGFGSRWSCNYVIDSSPSAPSAALATAGTLTFEPADFSSAESVVQELDLLLTSGRLDAASYAIITTEYARVLNISSCPVDRTEELCGRLVPGDELRPGEQITNANGEVLCMTYHGVAQHIGVDGREVYSTTYRTRGTRAPSSLRYNSGRLQLAGWIKRREGEVFRQNKWVSDWHDQGIPPAAFHSFLAGTCNLLDETAMWRENTYGYTSFDGVVSTVTCSAASTCGAPAPPARSPEYQAELTKTMSRYALQVAENLIAASTAFAVTNDPMPSNVSAPPAETRERRGDEYKALVVVFQNGGADTFNLLVPHSNCDNRSNSEWYTQTRGIAALDLDDVLQISAPPGTQLCDTMGIHPRFTKLQELYNDGDAAFLANIGPLVKPVTKEEVVNKEATLPAGLFAHNLQTLGAKTLHPQSTTGSSGVLGRILQAFEDQAADSDSDPVKGAAYSITTDKTMFRGSPQETVLLSAAQGMLTYEGSQMASQAYNMEERTEALDAFQQLVEKKAESVFAETHNDAMRKSLSESDRISGLLADIELTQNWDGRSQAASNGQGKKFVGQMQQVANVISAREAFDAERDIFFVEMNGFDTHNDEFDTVNTKFNDLNIGLSLFVDEMKAQGVWDQIAVQSLSEFGRTVTTNGRGTDHAWGGNYFLLGGKVKGGTIHGDYPELRIDGPNSVSANGHMMPSLPWEAIWKPLSTWLGVENEKMNDVMPNLHEFSAEQHLLETSDVFDP